MKSVLRKRFKRELTHEFGKYAVIFLFLAGVIGFVSGFLVSSDSMLKTYHEGKEKYQLEDGNFTLTNAAADTVLSAVEKENLKVYEKLYLRENTDDFTSHLRIYKNRTEGDLVCLMSGKMPAAVQEIALDRMYATYNKVKVGDIIKISGKELKVSGFVVIFFSSKESA